MLIKTFNKNFREVQGGRRPHPKKALKGHLMSAVMLNCGSQLLAHCFEPLLRAKSQELRAKPKGFLVAEGKIDGKSRLFIKLAFFFVSIYNIEPNMNRSR